VNRICIDVTGTPAPKGSFRISRKRGGRGFVVRKDSAATYTWEQIVTFCAKRAMANRLATGSAVAVDGTFRMPPPKSGQRARHTVKPDVDKLLRSTLDALSGVVFVDDSQVTSLSAHKIYASDASAAGALITVTEES